MVVDYVVDYRSSRETFDLGNTHTVELLYIGPEVPSILEDKQDVRDLTLSRLTFFLSD